MALTERDINGSPFSVGDEVQVRGRVTSITGASGATDGVGGAADSVLVTVDMPGNIGDKVATVTVSPVQCRRAAAKAATGVNPS
jgi:hypothetical protein